MSNPETTQMTKDPERTKLVQPKKTYRLEMLRDFEVTDVSGEKLVRTPGSVVEVQETEARRVLGFKFDGPYAFAGERSDTDSAKHKISIARLYKGDVAASSAPKSLEEEFAHN